MLACSQVDFVGGSDNEKCFDLLTSGCAHDCEQWPCPKQVLFEEGIAGLTIDALVLNG